MCVYKDHHRHQHQQEMGRIFRWEEGELKIAVCNNETIITSTLKRCKGALGKRQEMISCGSRGIFLDHHQESSM